MVKDSFLTTFKKNVEYHERSPHTGLDTAENQILIRYPKERILYSGSGLYSSGRGLDDKWSLKRYLSHVKGNLVITDRRLSFRSSFGSYSYWLFMLLLAMTFLILIVTLSIANIDLISHPFSNLYALYITIILFLLFLELIFLIRPKKMEIFPYRFTDMRVIHIEVYLLGLKIVKKYNDGRKVCLSEKNKDFRSSNKGIFLERYKLMIVFSNDRYHYFKMNY